MLPFQRLDAFEESGVAFFVGRLIGLKEKRIELGGGVFLECVWHSGQFFGVRVLPRRVSRHAARHARHEPMHCRGTSLGWQHTFLVALLELGNERTHALRNVDSTRLVHDEQRINDAENPHSATQHVPGAHAGRMHVQPPMLLPLRPPASPHLFTHIHTQ